MLGCGLLAVNAAHHTIQPKAAALPKRHALNTLEEWHRVLAPGGRFFVSVPDLDVLAKLFLDSERLTVDERFLVMRMMFGGHIDKYDYHVVGLNGQFLAAFLDSAGYVNTRRVQGFGIFL